MDERDRQVILLMMFLDPQFDVLPDHAPVCWKILFHWYLVPLSMIVFFFIKKYNGTFIVVAFSNLFVSVSCAMCKLLNQQIKRNT